MLEKYLMRPSRLNNFRKYITICMKNERYISPRGEN